MQKYLLLSHSDLLKHGIDTHPENSGRLKAIFEEFERSPYKHHLDLTKNRLATFEELSQVHDPLYVNTILSLEGKNCSLDSETLLTPQSVRAALLAAGLGLELIEQVIEGKIENGFALVRPPGHHARPGLGMGFCIFNNLAIAAKKALKMGLKRILIIDWDVHHGNGTQEMFYQHDRLLFIDIHQENLFPQGSGLLNEKGEGKGLGFTVNIPLPQGCRDADYFYLFDNLIKPLAVEYQPELILVSSGFDAHESDPLGFMNLTTRDYRVLSNKVRKLAQQLCNGKLTFFLEGGYDPYFLAKNVMECVQMLMATSLPIEEEENQLSLESIKTLTDQIYEFHVKQISRKAR